MKLVNMVKEQSYLNAIEEGIKTAIPTLLKEGNSREILKRFIKAGIVPPEYQAYFEAKLETARFVLKIERLFKKYGFDVQGILYLLDRVEKTRENYGTLHFIAAPNMGDDIVKRLTAFEIGPHYGLCGKTLFKKSITLANELENEPCFLPQHLELFARYGIKSIISIPIIINGVPVATMGLFCREHIPALSPHLTQHIKNKVISLEPLLDELQYDWQSIRKLQYEFIVSPEGKVHYIDPVVDVIFGFNTNEVNGSVKKNRHFTDGVFAEDIEEAEEAFKKAVREKTPTTCVMRYDFKNAGIFILEVQYSPVLNRDGTVRKVEGKALTNTVLCKKYEIELREAQLAQQK